MEYGQPINGPSPYNPTPAELAEQNAQTFYASEHHQGFMTLAVRVGIFLYGVSAGNAWLWVIGAVVIVSGYMRMQRAASVQHAADVAYANSLVTPGVRQ